MFTERVELNLDRASNRTYDIYTALAARHQPASVFLKTEVTREIADSLLDTNGWIKIALESEFGSLSDHAVLNQAFGSTNFANYANWTQASYFYDIVGEVFRTFTNVPRTLEEVSELSHLFLVSYIPEEEFLTRPACHAAALICAALEQDPEFKGKVNYFLINLLCGYTAYMLGEAEYMKPITALPVLKAIHTSLEIAYPVICLASNAEQKHSMTLTAKGRVFSAESDM